MSGLLKWEDSVQVRVETVFRLPEGPLLRRMVTGPEAPSQVSLKGLPASTLKSVLVNEALAATRAANSMGVMKNCILAVLLFGGRESVEKKKASGHRVNNCSVEKKIGPCVYGWGMERGSCDSKQLGYPVQECDTPLNVCNDEMKAQLASSGNSTKDSERKGQARQFNLLAVEGSFWY